MYEIGPYLRKALKKKNMKQKELAANLQLTPEHISKICLNKVQPSMDALIHICASLDMSFSEFFADTEGEPVMIMPEEAELLYVYRRLENYERTAVNLLVSALSEGKKIEDE